MKTTLVEKKKKIPKREWRKPNFVVCFITCLFYFIFALISPLLYYKFELLKLF
jgi:hypothetical protein